MRLVLFIFIVAAAGSPLDAVGAELVRSLEPQFGSHLENPGLYEG